MTVPAYLPYYVLGGSILAIVTLLLGIGRAVAKAGWPAEERTAAVRTAAFVLVGWFVLSVALAWLEVYRGTLDKVPTIQYGLLLPILLGALAIWRSELATHLIDALPQSWLVGVQLYRSLGVIFLVLYAAGQMPAAFSWPAGAGDVAVGLLAPVVAMRYARNPEANARTVAVWNIVGIIDLVVAVTMGFVTSPSQFQMLSFDLPNEFVSAFPLVLVPVYLVPLSIVLHIASLVKLRRDHLLLRLSAQA